MKRPKKVYLSYDKRFKNFNKWMKHFEKSISNGNFEVIVI